MNKKLVGVLSSLLLLSGLSACGSSSNTEMKLESDSDFTMLLSGNGVSANYYFDFNEHPQAQSLEEISGKTVDYIGLTVGEESLSFRLMLATKQIPDLMKINLDQEYSGGVDEAMKDGLTVDINAMVEEYAPNFMEKLKEMPNYLQSAYSDEGYLSMFGATMVEEEMRGLPFYGPMVNKTYLEQAGLDIPVTIEDWEEMLQAFQDLGVGIPLSFSGSEDFSALYDCFASSFGVTAGATYFQEDGVVKFSPLEDGYYEFVVLMAKWYENGWIDSGFSQKSQEDIDKAFGLGQVGATVTHINGGQMYGDYLDENFVFTPVPYPVLEVGDVISTRHYTPDFVSEPIFVYSGAENPEELIEWVDYFYSDEGILWSNWGTENHTFVVNEHGEKEFSDLILLDSQDTAPILLMNQYVFQDIKVVLDWDYQLQYYPEDWQKEAWEIWGQANYDNVLPDNMTYNLDERSIIFIELGKLPAYVQENTLAFITGQLSLEKYDKFIDTILDLCAEEFIEMTQAAYDRYQNRGK